MIQPARTLAALAMGLALGLAAASGPALAQGFGTARGEGARTAPGAKPAPKAAAKPAPEAKPAAEKPAPRGRAARGQAGGAKPPAAPPGLQATPVAVFGDWNVFAAGQGRARICYAITQPKARQPASLKRDAAYLFVTVRKAENLPNEIALIMGFAPKGGGQTASAGGGSAGGPALTVGASTYGLVVKEANAWLQNPADETRVVGEMGRAGRLVVKAVSLRGNASSDEYSLAGFGDAMKRAREECK